MRVNGKTERRTKTVIDWYPISGTHSMYLDDTPCCASRHTDAALLRKVEPFSTKVLKVYNPAYLAGFVAERYTLDVPEGEYKPRDYFQVKYKTRQKKDAHYDF